MFQPATLPGQSRKLRPKYDGTWRIVNANENFTYQLQECSTGHILPVRVHANRLKLFKTPTGRLRQSSNPAPTVGQTSSTDRNTSPSTPDVVTSSKTTQFKTATDILVNVYVGDITHERADGITNAANGDLKNVEGVAGALARASGPSLQAACSAYIATNGPLAVSQVTHTPAGRLTNVKYILHAVGPRAIDIPDSKKFAESIEQTFFNVFKYANNLSIQSLVVPAISAGIFQGNSRLIAKAAYDALVRYETTYTLPERTLTDIRFVCLDITTNNVFVDIFNEERNKPQDIVIASDPNLVSNPSTDLPAGWFAVDRVLGRKTKNGSIFYLCSWSDGSLPTWTRASDVSSALKKAYQESVGTHKRRVRNRRK
jgi:O-acetyl-ADP-ribose deacetylase (regulator of RNase III)